MNLNMSEQAFNTDTFSFQRSSELKFNLGCVCLLVKVETIGDAYMVVGGVPVPVSTHAERVANFALGMIIAAKDIKNPVAGNPIQVSACKTHICFTVWERRCFSPRQKIKMNISHWLICDLYEVDCSFQWHLPKWTSEKDLIGCPSPEIPDSSKCFNMLTKVLAKLSCSFQWKGKLCAWNGAEPPIQVNSESSWPNKSPIYVSEWVQRFEFGSKFCITAVDI